jgi:C4-dicarboxylate transporter DctM subunit
VIRSPARLTCRAFCLLRLPVWGRNLVLMGRNSLPGRMFNDETRKVMVDSSKTIIMLMFIIVNALLFAHVLTSERIPQAITDWMVGAGFNWFTFLIAVNLLLLLGGQFMEPSGLLLIVAPVVFPIAMELGVDPVHLGIIMVVNMEIGMITPPIGLNLFVTSGITGMSWCRWYVPQRPSCCAASVPDPGDLCARLSRPGCPTA